MSCVGAWDLVFQDVERVRDDSSSYLRGLGHVFRGRNVLLHRSDVVFRDMDPDVGVVAYFVLRLADRVLAV